MLARVINYGLVSVRPLYALSVTRQYCIETTTHFELIFGMRSSLNLPCSTYIVFTGNLGYLQKSRYLSLELCPKFWTRKICPQRVYSR